MQWSAERSVSYSVPRHLKAQLIYIPVGHVTHVKPSCCKLNAISPRLLASLNYLNEWKSFKPSTTYAAWQHEKIHHAAFLFAYQSMLISGCYSKTP